MGLDTKEGVDGKPEYIHIYVQHIPPSVCIYMYTEYLNIYTKRIVLGNSARQGVAGEAWKTGSVGLPRVRGNANHRGCENPNSLSVLVHTDIQTYKRERRKII